MDNLNNQRVINTGQAFDTRFIETKALYLYHFNTFPNISFVNRIDGEKAFEDFNKKFGSHILCLYTYRWYKHEKKKFQFDKTVLILNNDCILEFDNDYCEILHNGKEHEFVAMVTKLLLQHLGRQRQQASEINLIIRDNGGLELKPMQIKKTRLDCNLFYEDDFKEVDDTIQKRRRRKNDKGIVLLHELPGTGKTTYLRYLIGKNQKKGFILIP